MAMLRRKKAGAGGHGGSWVVSFADLMSLLMAFFVMLLSFSVQDQEKMKQAAGSVQDAFGIQISSSMTGVMERDGNPQRDFLKSMSPLNTKASTDIAATENPDNENQGQEANTFSRDRTSIERAAQYAMAAASLKQAWQDLPEITSFSDNIAFEESDEGLNIIIADRDGAAMFPSGSKYPYETTRQAITAMAASLQKMPNRIRITGHTAAGAKYGNPRYGPWELSFDRANIARQILEEAGFAKDRIESVAGRGESDPFYPGDPYAPSNQRISILLIYEKPPVPVDLKP